MEALITRTEIHHQIPQHLLRLRDKADAAPLDGEGIELWLEYEHEALDYGVDPDLSRADLVATIDASTVSISREDHRALHETDFVRWGRRGLETLQRYGRAWFRTLALKRWGKVAADELALAKV
jgi:hypothetical protein